MTEKDDPTISCTHLMVKLSVLAGRNIILKGCGNHLPFGRGGLIFPRFFHGFSFTRNQVTFGWTTRPYHFHSLGSELVDLSLVVTLTACQISTVVMRSIVGMQVEETAWFIPLASRLFSSSFNSRSDLFTTPSLLVDLKWYFPRWMTFLSVYRICLIDPICISSVLTRDLHELLLLCDQPYPGKNEFLFPILTPHTCDKLLPTLKIVCLILSPNSLNSVFLTFSTYALFTDVFNRMLGGIKPVYGISIGNTDDFFQRAHFLADVS